MQNAQNAEIQQRVINLVDFYRTKVGKESQIAKDANVFEQYKTQRYEQAKTQLSQEVANGKLTQKQADEILNKIKNEK